MDRRDFLYYSGAASLISTGIISPSTLFATKQISNFNNFKELLLSLLELNDERVPKLMELQDRNPESKNFGGVRDAWKIYTPGSTAGLIKGLSCSFFHPKSKYYHDDKLAESIELAANYLLKIQHSDGTIDLLSTNFHSTPDTAFVVEPIWSCYNLLKQGEYSRQKEILNLLKEFMLKAGEAFVVGGIHTPNHRWVVSSVLAMLNHSFPDERYENRIAEWLQEGVDIDKDGQYEEKSSYIYTPLTNRCLMNIAMYNNRPELFDIIEKNLEMTMYYVHPNGEVATEASGRQDQFRVGFMEHYYIPYRISAMRYRGKPRFWAMVELIEKTVPEKLLSYLPYFFTIPQFDNELSNLENGEIPTNYIKEFSNSNLVRIRRDNIDATILGDNPTFLTISKGKAVLASVRLASAFFGRGQFKSEKVTRVDDTFILNWEYTWGYFQPLPDGKKANYELPFDVDRRRREKSEIQHANTQISITEKNGKFELDFVISGTENVPFAIELGFRNGGTLEGVEKSTHFENAYILKDEYGKYQFEDDTIEFGPGQAEHEWTAIRGGLPKPDGECVYLTGFSPFKKKITIG